MTKLARQAESIRSVLLGMDATEPTPAQLALYLEMELILDQLEKEVEARALRRRMNINKAAFARSMVTHG